jgi:multicomponent Na+:H+ antiporter subunit C
MEGPGLFNYWMVMVLLMIGLYVVMAKQNLIKKVIGLNIFQTAIILFFISMGKVKGGSAPIIDKDITVYSNPVPHVLMLTAIVVGISVTALALALVVRIFEAYGTIEEDLIRQEEQE